tara:strand:+ start:13254 stop:13604 length:351 start_codon:yes stop_codon:yes gene_type:complete
MVDKLRMKDALYYRNLLFRTEYRNSAIMKQINDIKQTIKHQENTKKLLLKNNNLMKILIVFQLATLLQYSIKNFDFTNTYNDYASALLHLWEGHREQVQPFFESFTKWNVSEGSIG